MIFTVHRIVVAATVDSLETGESEGAEEEEENEEEEEGCSIDDGHGGAVGDAVSVCCVFVVGGFLRNK